MLSETGMIVKNGKKEEFAISAGSIAWWYDERLSRFVAFQQTYHEGETKGEERENISLSVSIPRFASRCCRLFFLFRPENNSALLELRGKSAHLRISLLSTSSGALSSGFCM